MQRKFLSGVAALAVVVGIGGPAAAADMPIRGPGPAPALFDWSGFYVGGHIGYGRSKTSVIGTSPTFSVSHQPSGIVGGMHIGQNWQMNTFVVGWEADLSATGWSKRTGSIDGGTRAFISDTSLLASLRGRLGMTFDRSLLYVTGGLAYAHAKGIVDSTDLPREFKAKFNSFGGVVGVGAEWMQTQNFSWRLEGLWYFFNKSKSGSVGSLPTLVNIKQEDAWVIRLGGSYHF